MAKLLATFVLVLAAAFALTTGAPVAAVQEGTARPNIIYVVADDADKQLLFSMPNIKRLLVDQGTFLENFYIPQAQCCPSRTSVLTGQYTHNHRVVNNNAPEGGFAKYQRMGHDPGNVAGPVEARGYNSGLFGKFLNEYGPQTSSSAYEGRNWTRWFGVFNQQRYGWQANDNGTVRAYGTRAANYADDVIWVKTRGFTFNQLGNGTPVFTYWSPLAPHSAGKGDYPAPPGYGSLKPGTVPSVNGPAYDEPDVSDKPSFIQSKPRLSSTQKQTIQSTYVGRYRMLRNVDDQVKELWDGVVARGQQNNTYLIVTSDNGWQQGEHRIDDSNSPPTRKPPTSASPFEAPASPPASGRPSSRRPMTCTLLLRTSRTARAGPA